MQARDVMTTNVVSVKLETPVQKIAELLLEHKISAVPVLDQSGAVAGMVSERDLLRMNGTDREKRREWWLTLLAEGEPLNNEFLASIHANTQRTARDIMSSPVMSVSEDTDLTEIGKLLISMQIKRVPVVREGRLRGIVSRADLIRALAKQRPARPQGEGLFGWTIHFDPFASQSEAKHGTAEEQALADEQGLTATDFRHFVADAVSKRSHQLEAARHAAEAARSSSIKELIDHHVSDEHWRTTLHQAHLAAERGERELLLLQFPAQLCSDGGRAINVAEPDWPATLRGEAAETYLRYEHELKPRGFHLIAKVLNFPGGYIGDIGLFLHWGGAKET
jgi:CBS domain-containing protein